MNTMTLGTSTVLIAAGAIMRYAITARGDGFDIPMIGTILMIAGALGALLTIVVYATSRTRPPVVAAGTTDTVQVTEHVRRTAV
jgi:hypothetical protein